MNKKRKPRADDSTKSAGGATTIKSVLHSLGSGLATLVMVGLITGCIVASVLTVYILQGIGSEEPIKLEEYEMGYTSIIIAYDKDGNEVELERLHDPSNHRIPIDYSDITQYTKDAIVAIEDHRFWEHGGVDWVRTTGAFVNMFVPIWTSQAGGSTIHQQLIKNITGDNDLRIDRKVREIFRAINLNANYTKEEVLESYLNVVPFGAGTSGIEAAANVYFDKPANELTLAESAAIVGITQKPTAYNPLLHPKDNRKRQLMVLKRMLEEEFITQQEYDDAVAEELVFVENKTVEEETEPSSFFVDHVIQSVIQDLMEQKDMTKEEASRAIFNNGYKIYTTVDMEMQEYVEEFYLKQENFPALNLSRNPEYPQSAAIITDHHGKILALVGGRGPKTESRSFNRATMAKRQPGSTFKPIGPYALAFEYDMITPTTMIEDSPINPEANPADHYPRNYYGYYEESPVSVEEAIYRSINTVAVKVTQLVTPENLFDHYYYQLRMTSLVDPTDIDISPMGLGGTTQGVTPLELVGAFQICVNGGTFTKPYAYTHVEDPNGRLVLKTNTTPNQVISEDTAVLLNKMTQLVVQAPRGTGGYAQIPNMPTAGKTGTSNDDKDQWFVGYTPYYIGNVWLGYDLPITHDKYGNEVTNSVLYAPNPYPTPILFRDLMAPLHEGLESIPFLDSPNVVQQQYCTLTGNLAGPDCPPATSWYKASNLPPTCSGIHPTAEDEDEEVMVDEDGNPILPVPDSDYPEEVDGPIDAPAARRSDSGEVLDGDVLPAA